MPPIDPSKVFTESIALVRADDSELEQTLREDEQLVERSVTNMQTDLDKLDVSVTSTGNSAQTASATFGALGAQMSAVGGTAGQLGGSVASLGSAFIGLGTAIFGLPGILLAAAAGIGLLVSHLSKHTDEVERAKQAELEYQDAIEKRTQSISAQNETVAEATRKVAALRASLGTPADVARVAGAEQERLIQNRIDEGRAREIEIKASGRFGSIVDGQFVSGQEKVDELQRINDLERQLETQRVLQRGQTVRKLSDIEDAARQKELAADKALASEREALRLRGVAAFEATPEGRVAGTLLNAIRATQERSAIAEILNDPMFRALPTGLLEQVTASLGFGGAGGINGRGGIGGGGVSTAQFAGGPIVEQAAIVRREGLEQKRTDDLGSLKEEGIPLLRSIATALAEGLGAN